ncbi:MAG: HAD-IIB family hydrolase [Ruminococcaceae bacterium]|jgi:Cof subfamily protein (haloacid dehalogenase superfamily)|nr:HAD-IIB family hydrolase [Oscillospiraceae bacterium]
MESKTYAVFLDLDGTLMTHNQIPSANITAIAAVRRRGHKVFLNTGRSLACIPGHVIDGLELDGIIAGIGSHIMYQDNVLLSTVMPLPLLRLLETRFEQQAYPCVFEGEQIMLYTRLKAAEGIRFVHYLDGENTLTGTYRQERITKATVFTVMTEEDQAYLSTIFNVYQHETYAEIAMKGCTKAGGMQRMLDHLALDKTNCIAMGDSANDHDMLAAAGISVAMGNATAKTKEICDLVTAEAGKAGVALALEQLLPSAFSR